MDHAIASWRSDVRIPALTGGRACGPHIDVARLSASRSSTPWERPCPTARPSRQLLARANERRHWYQTPPRPVAPFAMALSMSARVTAPIHTDRTSLAAEIQDAYRRKATGLAGGLGDRRCRLEVLNLAASAKLWAYSVWPAL